MDAPPVPSFRFRVLWNDRQVSRVRKITGLKRTVEVSEHRDGAALGSTVKAPGQVVFHPVTLERAVGSDVSFREIADAAATAEPGSELRGSLMIEVQDETGSPVLRCTLIHAWVSSYECFVELDVQGDGPAIERIVVEFDSWIVQPVAE